MNKFITFAACASMVPAIASAGEVFGVVKQSSGVVEGADVAANCGGNAYGPVKTDKKGSYRLAIAQTGKCELTVSHGGKSATIISPTLLPVVRFSTRPNAPSASCWQMRMTVR